MIQTLDERQQKIQALRTSISERGVKHFIDGAWADSVSGETFETATPIDGSFIASVASGDARDIDLAARAAARAFPAWRDLSGKERRRILNKVADLT